MKTNVIIDAKAIEDYNIDDIEPYRPRPRFDTDHRGVWWINVRTGKDGEAIEAEPLLLSDPIDIIGTGQDNDGAYYRIIRWQDKITRQTKTAAIPQAEIGTVQGWQRLQSYGLTVMSGRAKRERLADYLQTQAAVPPLPLPTAPAGTATPTSYPAAKPSRQTAKPPPSSTTATPAKRRHTDQTESLATGSKISPDTQRETAAYAWHWARPLPPPCCPC